MAIPQGVLHDVLSTIDDEKLRRRLAEALSQETTCLSYLGHEIFSLANEIDDIDLDELHTARPETVGDELRRCEIALGRLSLAFHGLLTRIRPEP